jgi:hypothetical protein
MADRQTIRSCMKTNFRKSIFLLVIVLLLVCAVGVIVEIQFNILQRAYDNYVMDNRNHYLSCEELPTKTEVESIVEQHQDIIQQIQQVAPGFVGVEIDSSTCAGKADLLIWYGTHQQRIAIEKIISGDTFFGVPYRLRNY